MLPESLVAARKLLEEITPLQTDCGLVCGGACCQTHPGEETGMLLFPGEAEMYRGEEGFTLVDSPHGTILVCEGRCNRANRPLACRMFPLVMLLRPRWRENRDGCGGASGLPAGTAGEKRPFAGFCRGSASGGESACAGQSTGVAFAAFDGHAGRIKGASGAVSREEGTCLRR